LRNPRHLAAHPACIALAWSSVSLRSLRTVNKEGTNSGSVLPLGNPCSAH
jgi:hypothetical protein